MGKRAENAILVVCIILLIFSGAYYFFADRTGPVQDLKDQRKDSSAAQQAEPSRRNDDPAAALPDENKAVTPVYHPKDIEEIKKQVYDLSIEDVDDIPLLDSVIQTGNRPTKDFWAGNWASVDDNKDEVNGFNLEPQKDGTFMFHPDEATTRTYTFFETPRTYKYDPEKKEFSWEMDYYGKTISHRVRFINENVVAMMLVSGRKVTLDLYQKQPDRPAQNE